MPEGIILARRDFREHDELISIITREYGRIDVRARGVKKITSKLSAHLEPCSLVWFEIAHGKEMMLLRTARLITSFSSLRHDYAKSLHAGFAAHAVHALTLPGTVEHGIFDVLASWLDILDRECVPCDTRFLDWLMLSLVRELGFPPRYRVCVGCARSEGLGFWSFAQGGVVCRGCVESQYCERGSVYRISSHVLDDMYRLEYALPHELARIDALSPAVHQLIWGHIQYHAPVDIGNWTHTCVPA